MQKRVLSFLMVLALVISMLPMTLVSAETAAAEPGYTVTIQKAHNQTENFLAVDVYLQANTADQGDVTGYQFTVTPAEGLNITSVVDFTGNDGIAGSGTEFVYSPTLADPIAVGTSRVLVATVTLTGETLPAAAAEARFSLQQIPPDCRPWNGRPDAGAGHTPPPLPGHIAGPSAGLVPSAGRTY